MPNRIDEVAFRIWETIGLMGRQEWLIVALAVVVFGYYCAKD